MRYSQNGQHIVMERGQNAVDGPRRIEVCEAATGAVLATFVAGFNPRWVDARRIVAESTNGEGDFEARDGFMVEYLPANRGQVDANGDGLSIVSDLRTAFPRDKQGTLPRILDAREPRVGARDIAVRHPDSGVLRIHTRITAELGPCEDSRWSSETLVWWLGGRVWGRTTPDQGTVELTAPGRACSHPVPLWTGSRLFVGLVLDDGELWLCEWGDRERGWFVGKSDGAGFDWDVRDNKAWPGLLHVCYFDPLGKPVFTSTDTTAPPQSMLKPAPQPQPEPVPDIPWTPDPTRTVDMLAFHKAASTAYLDHGDGTGELWMHKSQERPNWGENRDHDQHWIGFVEDRSTGTRMITLPTPRPKKDAWTNTTRDRWSPEQIEAWNTANPDRPVGDFRTLPLAGYGWIGNRPFMPRHVTGRSDLIFRAQYDWWDEPHRNPVAGANPPRGRWELHPPIRIHIAVVTGYARFNGHDVYAMSRYGRPLDEMGPNDEAEWSLWGPDGWIGFIVFDHLGRENVSARRIAPPDQRATPLNGPFVHARFPTTYPIYDAAREQPQPPKEPDQMTEAEAVRRASYPVPSHIAQGALNVFRANLLERDLVPPDLMSGGAFRYFFQHYCPAMSALLVKHDVPGDDQTWGHFSLQAVGAATAAYNRDQKPTTVDPGPVTPQPPTPEPSALVPLHIDGTTFRRPDGTIWKYRAVTAFSAFQDFLAGRDLTPYAAWTRSVGGNAWRIFYTWVVTDFNPRRMDSTSLRNELEAFRQFMDEQGLYSHNTVLCDQVPGSSVLMDASDQRTLFNAVAEVMQGRLVEEMNEGWKNGGSGRIAAEQFRGTFGTRSSWQDGERPDAAGSLIDFTSEHTPRDAEWMRKAKNLLETSVQGMEKIGWPASRKPAVAGEPIGIFEHDIPGSRTANASDVADYYAVSELFGAGACLHGDKTTLQTCHVPGPNAQRCAEWALAARVEIQADAQLGEYTRGGLDSCPLEHDDARALRTFAMLQGNRATAVVVRPVAGWEPRARDGWRIDGVGGPNGHIVHLVR